MMDIQSIANWVGWPIVAAALIILQWFFQQRIRLLKEKLELLQDKLNNCQQHTPDILAKSLAERYKILQEELERTQSEREENAQRVKYLESELDKTKKEASQLSIELAQVQEVLWSIDILPRDGRVRLDLAESILMQGSETSCIYLMVRKWGNPNEAMIAFSPYYIGIVYPGMHKTYLVVANFNGDTIGLVENTYGKLVYERDYCETVKTILEETGSKSCSFIEEAVEAYLLESSVFIPFDESLFYIKVPIGSINKIIEGLDAKFGSVG